MNDTVRTQHMSMPLSLTQINIRPHRWFPTGTVPTRPDVRIFSKISAMSICVFGDPTEISVRELLKSEILMVSSRKPCLQSNGPRSFPHSFIVKH